MSSICSGDKQGEYDGGIKPGNDRSGLHFVKYGGEAIFVARGAGPWPVLAAFFKVSCPTCQYTFPFLQRIYEAHGSKNVAIVGISQNDRKDTAAFLKQYGVTFPVLLDDTRSYPASNAYGLTHVPSIFWIAPDGEIEIASIGWSRKDIEEFSRHAAGDPNRAPALFLPGEQVSDFRAG